MQNTGGLARGLGGNVQLVGMALARLGQFALLPFQPRDRFACVAVQPGLALDIAGQLLNAPLQCFDHMQRTLFLLGQGITLHHKALHNRCGNGLFLAARW